MIFAYADLVVFAEVRCDCKRAVTIELRAEDVPPTAAALAAAQQLGAFAARLTATARGWAVGANDVTCDRCVDRPDAGTVYQDSGPDWGRR